MPPKKATAPAAKLGAPSKTAAPAKAAPPAGAKKPAPAKAAPAASKAAPTKAPPAKPSGNGAATKPATKAAAATPDVRPTKATLVRNEENLRNSMRRKQSPEEIEAERAAEAAKLAAELEAEKKRAEVAAMLEGKGNAAEARRRLEEQKRAEAERWKSANRRVVDGIKRGRRYENGKSYESSFDDEETMEGMNEQEMKEVFDTFDANKSGSIDSKELADVLRALGQNPTKTEIDEMIQMADSKENANGMIEFDEFQTMVKRLWKDDSMRKQELINAFKIFDLDGNGFITAEELKEVLCKMGDEAMAEEDAEEMMKMIDVNRDGKISYEEFAESMASKE